MKSFARSYVCWPGLDKALEDRVRKEVCRMSSSSENASKGSDSTLGVAGETLVTAARRSCWIYLGKDDSNRDRCSLQVDRGNIVPSTLTTATIDKLRSIFATHGLPQTIVSDNGPAFTSAEFKEFLRRNGVEHVFSLPYHPSSNGLAECAVQTVKYGVKKMEGPLETRLARYLFKYIVIPQAVTSIALAELLSDGVMTSHTLGSVIPDCQRQGAKEPTLIGISEKSLYGELVLDGRSRNVPELRVWSYLDARYCVGS